jgi:hypothetical protein
MIGAALFNRQTYEEIEADQGALGQALGVVLLVTLCGIIGGLISGLLGDVSALKIILGVIGGLVFGIIRWALWVTVMYWVGGKMLRTSNTQTSWGELGRVMGFAYTPGVLSVLSFVPAVGGLFPFIGFCWTLAAVTVAVRQAMDFESTGRAIGVVLLSAVIGFIPWVIVWVIQWSILGGPEVPEVQGAVQTLLALI